MDADKNAYKSEKSASIDARLLAIRGKIAQKCFARLKFGATASVVLVTSKLSVTLKKILSASSVMQSV